MQLAEVCRDTGNADHLIALLGDKEMDAYSFFVADTDLRPDLVKTGSSTYRENANFPMVERRLPQRTLADIVTSRGLGSLLSMVEVILLEMSLAEYNKSAPLIARVLSELTRLGFVLCDIVEEHRHWGGGLLQIDGLFVRPTSRFRPQPRLWN